MNTIVMSYYVFSAALALSFFLLANYAILTLVYGRKRVLDVARITRFPKVSILKPISHPDDFLEKNIETFFMLDYPDYEIVFGMDSADKECLDIVERARRKFPDIPSRVISTVSPKLLNPKITTLLHMEPHCQGELYWVTDSNIRVERDTLMRLVHEYAVNGSKVVFSPIRGTGSQTLGSIIENAHVNMFVSGSILGGWAYLKRPVIVGKSILIEKKAMHSIGGFERFREYLAEDYMMGQIYRQEGVPLATNHTWVTNYSSYSTIGQFYSRMERWAKLRFHMGLGTYLIEILTNPLAIAGVSVLVLGRPGLHLLWVSCIVTLVIEYVILFANNTEDRKNPVVLALYPLCMVVKAVVLFFVFLAPFFSLKVHWRGRKITIGHLSRIIDIEEPKGTATDRDSGVQHAHDSAAGEYVNLEKKAWVVSVLMGLGHMRASYPLRDIAEGGIIIDGNQAFCGPEEFAIWERLRKMYYVISKAERLPVIGKPLMAALNWIEQIPSFYTHVDLSKPTWAVKYLYFTIRKRRLCGTLIEKVKTKDLPLLSTFYAAPMAAEIAGVNRERNYVVICDSDINRVWVPENPRASTLKYLIPCSQVRKRLLAYGVPKENIFLTGFPLPKENIGGYKMKILKDDLFNRLLRLDPNNKFFTMHDKDVLSLLEKTAIPEKRENHFTVMFAVGGAGAQSDMAEKILNSLRGKIVGGTVSLILSAGVQESVYHEFMNYITELKLNDYMGKGVQIVYHSDVFSYMEQFNRALRETDVLWTKPSELSFYCALGIPIMLAPSVGVHEIMNRNWLREIHAGVKPSGPLEYTDDWLLDLRDNGRLASAAWDGFLNARKLGTYKIEELMTTGKCTIGSLPMEQ